MSDELPIDVTTNMSRKVCDVDPTTGWPIPIGSKLIDGKVVMPEITMIPVQSSNIASVGYDEAAGELHVRFKVSGARFKVSGATNPRTTTYIYPGVAKDVYNDLIGIYNETGGVGRIFDRVVKKVVDPKLVRKVVRP